MEMDVVVNGPWGGPGGTDFYDGRGDVVELAVHYNKHAVTMLRVTYEQSGARFQSAPHGGASGDSSWSSRLGKGEESAKVSVRSLSFSFILCLLLINSLSSRVH
jgi:hypothetical protein